MLPPPDIHLTRLDGTPVQAELTALPGLFGTWLLGLAVADAMRPRATLPVKAVRSLAFTGLMQAAYALHTDGHIRSARRVGAPMHAIILEWGLFTNQYLDERITPRQHNGRAVGGPLASSLGLAGGVGVYTLLRRVPVIGDLAELWVYANAIILAASLLPTPHFDGGSLVKWSVANETGEEALGAEAVQTAGSLTIGGLLASALALLLWGRVRPALLLFGGAGAAILDLFFLKGKLP